MGTTPIYALPYPGLGDSPNSPNQVEALAEAVEAQLVRIDGSAVLSVPSTGSVTSPFLNQIVFNTGDGCAYKWSGSAWVLFHPGETWIFKAATETVTNSTTLQNDDVFAFNSAINSAYAVQAFVPYDGAADPAGGLKMGWTGPTGATMLWSNFGTSQNVPPALVNYNAVVEGIAGGRGVGTNASTPMACKPEGTLITAGTGGTVRYVWAQGLANATPTRVLAGAWMKFTKMA